MLNPKQRSYLKSLAHPLKACFQIGKDGLSENLRTDVLHYLNKHDAHGVLVSKDCKVEVLSKGIYTYQDKGYISIFSMNEKTVVSLKDLKYELNYYELNNYTTLGVDNEFINKIATIEIHEGVLIVVRNKE